MNNRTTSSNVGRWCLTTLSAAACLCVAACSPKVPESKPAPAASNAPSASTAQTAIEGFTGKTAVDAGRKAKEQIEKISAKRNADLEETME